MSRSPCIPATFPLLSWDPLRPGDFGVLWEHLVLEDLQARLPDVRVCYWRDKAGHEVDFVLARARGKVDAIECT